MPQGKVHYFRIPVDLSILCEEDGRLGKSLYLDTWRGIPNENEVSRKIEGVLSRHYRAPIRMASNPNSAN